MPHIKDLSNDKLVKLVENRWNSGHDLFDEVADRLERNRKDWKNDPDWLSRVSEGRSKARNNRTFSAQEHLLNFILARPAQPVFEAEGLEDEQAQADTEKLIDDLSDFLQDLNGKKAIKSRVKRAFRNLLFSRLLCIKVGYSPSKKDIFVRSVQPDAVRFSPNATTEEECDWVIEDIEEDASSALELFRHKTDRQGKDALQNFLNVFNLEEEDVLIKNPKVNYREAWLSYHGYDVVAYIAKNQVIAYMDNPYWDFDGTGFNEEETKQLGKAGGRRRRSVFSQARSRRDQEEEKAEKAGEEQQGQDTPVEEEQMFFNHFDRPRKPYIIATLFDTEEKAVGSTDFYEQSRPLQDDASDRKRSMADNARFMTGIWLIDKARTNLKRKDAQKIRAEAEGFILADNATQGIRRDTGQGLPAHVIEDYRDSLEAINDMWGTTDTFRGVREGQETAEGRAILREQAVGRLTEVIETVDFVYDQIYNWELQIMKTMFTEEHFMKFMGRDGSMRSASFLNEDLSDMVVKVKNGTTLPEDNVFKMQRANTAFDKGAISSETYLEETGWENPSKVAKEGVIYQTQPLASVELEEEDIARMQQLQQGQQGQEGQGGQAGQDQARAQQLAQVRDILQSDEFQNAPAEEQNRILDQLQERFPELDVAKLRQ